jgi:hypothetical protein
MMFSSIVAACANGIAPGNKPVAASPALPCNNVRREISNLVITSSLRVGFGSVQESVASAAKAPLMATFDRDLMGLVFAKRWQINARCRQPHLERQANFHT